MKLKEAFYQAQRNLGNFLEAAVLFDSCLGLEILNIYLNPDRTLTKREEKLLDEAINKRKNHLPLAYITGNKEFYSLEFKVTPDTFIPRPETEFIVDAVLERLPITDHRLPITIVDLGTGCGNIAIALAKYIPNAEIYATDISKKTLAAAKENARRHEVKDRVTFSPGDLSSPLEDHDLEGTVDFLVSNPPYISRREFDSLMPEIANHEPRIALDGGGDGLSFYSRIIEEVPRYLKSPGYLILEVGIDQALRVKKLIEKTLEFDSIEIIKDYSGIERVISARKRSTQNAEA